jgi:glutaredoxin
VVVRVYVGRDCHLCETARVELERLRDELGFELVEVDITGEPDLERRHRERLPVIEADGDEISIYRVDERALRERSPTRRR